MSQIKIAKGYIPGSLGRVVELHGAYYHDHWGFGLFFEAKVAVELSEFLKRYDETRDGFWTVLADGRVEGSIAIDGFHAESEGAHLRWSSCRMPYGEKEQVTSSSTPLPVFVGIKVIRKYIYGHLRGSAPQGISTKKEVLDSLRSIEEPSGELRSTNSGSSAL